MQTILIKISPEYLDNPDLELCNVVPFQIETYTNLKVTSKESSFLNFQSLGLWFITENALDQYPKIVELFHQVKFLKNDLTKAVSLYICDKETEKIEDCQLVYGKEE